MTWRFRIAKNILLQYPQYPPSSHLEDLLLVICKASNEINCYFVFVEPKLDGKHWSDKASETR